MSRLRAQAMVWMLAVVAAVGGCEVDSFFNPSDTGRFEHTPTTIPILDRIDVIERERDPWSRATEVTNEDLLPSDLTYRLRPGDVVTVEVTELVIQGQIWRTTRRVDAGGYFRMPAPISDVQTAGLTVQEFQDELIRLIDEHVMRDPEVNVLLEEGGGFQFTIYGAVAGAGLYSLRRPDLRLLDAVAQAGGVPLNTDSIYIIREVPLIGGLDFEPARRPEDPESFQRERPGVDIEDLIRQLEESDEVSPGLLKPAQDEPPIDIDDLEPVPLAEPPDPVIEEHPEIQPLYPDPPPVRVPNQTQSPAQDTFIYVPERQEWVRVGPERTGVAVDQTTADIFAERVIVIPFQKLKQGDSSFNIVIRPNDRIYVRERDIGVVYIDGHIVRPGVYNLPSYGRLTVSRLVAAAGGFRPLAIPGRVDLTRVVGAGREATVRLNLAAIRKKTEPDLYLRADDHIIIGTSWFATPLAIFRNGLRMTYGFGFLLDRNFGNDVFGAPPFSRQ